jgi:hypothetical protein
MSMQNMALIEIALKKPKRKPEHRVVQVGGPACINGLLESIMCVIEGTFLECL